MNENIVKLTKCNFESEVVESKGVILVDFYANWCQPCLQLNPIIDELSNEYNGKIKVGKINVDEEGKITAKNKIVNIPTILIFKDGMLKKKIIGLQSKTNLKKYIDENLI